jgi:glycosyltransferase involved in cell wall biosynthesis
MGVDVSYARQIYWELNGDFQKIYSRAHLEEVDLWLANDWTVLPIAEAIAREQGVPYAYDTHELAIEEYAQRWKWRVFQRPLIVAIERQGIRGAAFVTCVSQGIADQLFRFHRLDSPPMVVRNVPNFVKHCFRPTGENIRVLYHGLVTAGRGLEACIQSVALWRSEISLTIRGPGSETYLTALRTLAREAKVSERVVFAPPLPMTDLVREAVTFDIGLFALPGYSLQNSYVLPNKFFEYIMAGLALCVSDLPEMTPLLLNYKLGHSISAVTPQAIAAAINAFDRNSIDLCKRNSIKASVDLNWEAEARVFLRACNSAIAARRPHTVDALRSGKCGH